MPGRIRDKAAGHGTARRLEMNGVINLCLVAIVPWKPETQGEKEDRLPVLQGETLREILQPRVRLHANRQRLNPEGMQQIHLPGKEPV